jgi:glycerol-3-phosphate acyltransferase PlsY
MNPAAERIVCLLIGYLCGNLVTGEIVARACTGRPARELGTSGNPGMANVMDAIGMKEGLIVLAGDIAKVIAATVLARYLFGTDLGSLSVCWAGLGATLGHNFPFWMKFRGGKGVATTCSTVVLCSPVWGLTAMLAGLLTVFATQLLSIGGVVIPLVYTVLAFVFLGREAGILGGVLTLMMLQRFWKDLCDIPSGEAAKTDVLGGLFKKLKALIEKIKELYGASGASGDGSAMPTLDTSGLEDAGAGKSRRSIRFHGHVQGVGFRYQAQNAARQLGLTGWVRNEFDGSVSMEVQGQAEAIDRLVEFLGSNRWINIREMDTELLPVDEKEDTFKVEGY